MVKPKVPDVILIAMRVIAGLYRGRRLLTPEGERTRPILDRVKVGLFDWLGSQLALPGSLPPLQVLDLFCGGGSLGIEALSRGAAGCFFVDTDRQALVCLKRNIEALGLGPTARIVACSAESLRLKPAGAGGFGLIFLDPPYPLSENLAAGSTLYRVFDRLGSAVAVTPGALLVWRHPDGCAMPEDLNESWVSLERRTWNRMAVTMFEYQPQEPS
jgi:16S rRNA (guanine966-N2)-methyltransferase